MIKKIVMTERERSKILKRNPGNDDILYLLSQYDQVCIWLNNRVQDNKRLQTLIDRERKEHRRDNQKSKRLLAVEQAAKRLLAVKKINNG